MVIISTVLPMTIETKIKPLMSKHVKLCYNPFFIAMSTAIHDFLHPEIVLFGIDDKYAVEKVKQFYRTIHNAPFHMTSIVNAELVKMNYNTMIGLKINFANNLGIMCHLINQELKKYDVPATADTDTVIDCLLDCKDRIISERYLRSGMPDSGGCHVRDNITLAYLAEELKFGSNLYTEQLLIRDKHIEFFIRLIMHEYKQEWNREKNIKIAVLGKAYKPEVNLMDGSCGLLMQSIMKEKNIVCQFFDPHIDNEPKNGLLQIPHIYFIATKHKAFAEYDFPEGSTIIDPFGYIPKKQGIKVIHIGRAK